MICPSCHLGTAQIDKRLGVLPCRLCIKRHRNLRRSSLPPEFTSDSIKQQRKMYRKDILPIHNRGQLDKGWLDRYGAKKAKQRGFTDEEIKNARYVWDGVDEYYPSHV